MIQISEKEFYELFKLRPDDCYEIINTIKETGKLNIIIDKYKKSWTEKGCIKKTALEEAREYYKKWAESNNDEYDNIEVVNNLHDLYEKVIEEIRSKK